MCSIDVRGKPYMPSRRPQIGHHFNAARLAVPVNAHDAAIDVADAASLFQQSTPDITPSNLLPVSLAYASSSSHTLVCLYYSLGGSPCHTNFYRRLLGTR